MNRRKFLIQMGVGAALTPLFAAPARAESVADQVVQQLKSQGYGKIEISRTLLGRIRIVATRSDFRREIVIDRRTGEVLRDLLQPLPGRRNGKNSVQIRDDTSGSGSSDSGSGSSTGSDSGDDTGDDSGDDKGDDSGDDKGDDSGDDKGDDSGDDKGDSGSDDKGEGGDHGDEHD